MTAYSSSSAVKASGSDFPRCGEFPSAPVRRNSGPLCSLYSGHNRRTYHTTQNYKTTPGSILVFRHRLFKVFIAVHQVSQRILEAVLSGVWHADLQTEVYAAFGMR